ncbi:hypothetical protein [Dyella tabacisoli]|uniref:Baseplate protein J-like domain-containing protein n=1 Tax=Dyella tabacisoli TaxID=2282381 RepID=A0A369UKR5_9GAMM|nr:hypothetical protein [Dyella tabacisoli]RDD81354.1 hypothetical protein DVJ77_13795 [Dyella tabacisoli]
MAFELPDLDTRNSAALQAELIRRIPQFSSLWTDFNDSDPGITLLQMLCWIGESLLYQANAIPIETQQNFLREVLGLALASNNTAYSQSAITNYDFAFQRLRAVLAEVDAGEPLTRAPLQHAVLDYLAQPYLALSCSDAEALALETNQMIAAQQAKAGNPKPVPLLVQRADALVRDEATSLYILSDARWAYQFPPYPNTAIPDALGGLRRVLLLQKPSGSDAQSAATAQSKLLNSVSTYLAPRVLLGSRVNVWAAQLTEINVRVAVRCLPNVLVGTVLDALLALLFAYFQPVAGWRYNQPPVLENLQLLIEGVPGVAALENIDLTYLPTAQLPTYAQVGVNFLIADLPPGPAANFYYGLPQVRCLDLYARSAA